MMVVRFESVMEMVARSKPALTAAQGREPQMQFLAYAFVDQHVGVHGHTDGQHYTGDAGQGQGGAEAGHARHDDEHGEAEHDVGDDAAHAVVDGHEHDHGGGTHQSGVDAAVDGFLAQGRTDGTFFQHRHGRGQRTGTQHDGQVRGFLRGELAGVTARPPAMRCWITGAE